MMYALTRCKGLVLYWYYFANRPAVPHDLRSRFLSGEYFKLGYQAIAICMCKTMLHATWTQPLLCPVSCCIPPQSRTFLVISPVSMLRCAAELRSKCSSRQVPSSRSGSSSCDMHGSFKAQIGISIKAARSRCDSVNSVRAQTTDVVLPTNLRLFCPVSQEPPRHRSTALPSSMLEDCIMPNSSHMCS